MLPKAFLDRERKRTNHTHKRRVRRKKPGTVFCVITIKSNILNPFPLPGTSQILLLHHIALLLSHSYAGESIRRCMETNHRNPPPPFSNSCMRHCCRSFLKFYHSREPLYFGSSMSELELTKNPAPE